VDPLPERVRLVAAPGALRDVVLEVLGWRVDDGETLLTCRLVDGSVGRVPAAWTDLPLRVVASRSLGVLGSPAGWRRLAEVAAGVGGRPVSGAACVENGGADGGAAGVVDRREDDRCGRGVGALPPAVQQRVMVALARLLARLVEGERDE
jgi:hypothetical protein